MHFMKIVPILFCAASVHAAEVVKTIKFSYQNAEIGKIIADYAAAAGQRFVVDEQVKGKSTLINQGPISLTEAYNELSSALAANGAGIGQEGNVMHVMTSRALQRDNAPLVTEVPPALPVRMVTWIYQVQYTTADEINTKLRILASRDGELVPYTERNKLVISDWTTNLNRIAAILKEIDVPARPKK